MRADTTEQRDGDHATAAIVLGSRSPRRRELLATIVDPQRIVICAPTDPTERGFADCNSRQHIETRLAEVVADKLAAVLDRRNRELSADDDMEPVVLVADTVIIAAPDSTERRVLGQPEGNDWEPTVRGWLRDLLSGRTHEVWTRFSAVRGAAGVSRTVCTRVEFAELTDAMIDWYVATGESQGKAGGYAIQGHASAFVNGFTGSITNVIGLPVLEVAAALAQLGVSEIWSSRS